MKTDILTKLLDDAKRTASHRKHEGNTYFIRERITPPKKMKVAKTRQYSDFERFQFYFHKREGRTLHQWRDMIDAEMREAERQEALHGETT